MVRFLLALILCPLVSPELCAQPEVGVKVGYSYQRSSYGEVGVLIYERRESLGSFFEMTALNVGSDFRLGGSEFIAGPKISVEAYYLFFFSSRISTTFFTDFSTVAPAISPEFGISYFGFIYVMAGYSWTISNHIFWDTTGPKLSIGVNISGWKKTF